MLVKLVVLLENDLRNIIVELKSRERLIHFFINILNLQAVPLLMCSAISGEN